MIEFRRASLDDSPFLIQTILSAESFPSHTDPACNTYCQLFSLSRKEAESLIQEMLEQEEPGSEFDPQAYLLAIENEKPLAACCAWIEDEKNPSSTLKAQMIAYLLGQEKWKDAQTRLKLLSLVALTRTAGTLQLESFYTIPEARGKGLAAQLIQLHLKNYPNISAEIQLVNNNEKAIQAYQKAGFQIDLTSETHENLLRLLGGTGKVRMALKR